MSQYSEDELLLRSIGTSIFECLKENNLIFEGWLDKEFFERYCEIKKIKKINGAFTLSFIFIVLAVIINVINFSSDIFNFEVAASYLLGS